MQELKVIDLGKKDYLSTYELQLELVDERIRGEIGDVLVLVEHHPPVITLGRSSKKEHLLVGPEVLKELGIQLVEVDRGGDITYHGPGQIVGYPILDLNYHGKDLHRLLRLYEEVMLKVIASYGLIGSRKQGLTGAWVGDKKIGVIGVAVKRWVTYHGFAFNVQATLENFSLIVPCGLQDYGVTSLEDLIGRPVPMEEVKERLLKAFREVFGFSEFQYVRFPFS